MKCALLFTSMGLATISTASYLATLDPAHAMMQGLGCAFVMGVIGGIMGYMLDNPGGQRNRFWNRFWKDLLTLKPIEEPEEKMTKLPVEAEEIPSS